MSLEAPTYNEISRMYRHFKLLNGDPDAITALLATGVTPASFASWYATTGNAAKFAQLMSSPNGAAAVVASSTAMNAVVASSTAMNAVAASSTAMNAVAASSTAMNAVAASSTAMNAVAASSAAIAIVFSVASAKSQFKSSVALPITSIPAMTSANFPSGNVSASTIYSTTYDGWKAFDKNEQSRWLTASTVITNSWLLYQFTSPVFIHSASINTTNGGTLRNFRVEYSDDAQNWKTAASGTHAENVVASYDVLAEGRHKYWRLFALDSYSSGFIAVTEFDLKGFA